MKSGIKDSGLIKVPGDNTIDVCYYVPDASILAEIVGGITPVMWGNKKIDEQALADYDAFVTNVYGSISEYFDIVDIKENNKSKTSFKMVFILLNSLLPIWAKKKAENQRPLLFLFLST